MLTENTTELWGPSFSDYLHNPNFHLSRTIGTDNASDPNSQDTSPLITLENHLSQLGMETQENDPVALSGSNVMDLLSAYVEATGARVRVNYQISHHALQDSESPPMFSKDSGSTSTWDERSRTCAREALEKVAPVSLLAKERPASLDKLGEKLAGSPRDRTQLQLLWVLWEDRARFLKLCMNGLLPGCSVFFFKLVWVFPAPADIRYLDQVRLFFQDICFRLYLVGSARDRQILGFVIWITLETTTSFEWEEEYDRTTSVEDTRSIIQAYDGLLYVSQHDDASAGVLSLQFMHGLHRFVGQTFESNPSLSHLAGIHRISLNFVWLFFDRRRLIDAVDQADMLQYAGDILNGCGL
ncbi:hypothetical protein FRC09_007644, partial [Ceratobasidium sp. 395]